VYEVDAGYGVGTTFRDWVHRTFGHSGWHAEK
jgi:hypothetical protein